MGRVAFALGAAAALIIAGVVVTFSFEPRSTTPSGGPSSLGPCSSSIPDDPLPNHANESESNLSHLLVNGSTRSVAFVMRPGAIATVCISYSLGSGLGNLSASDFAVIANVVNATFIGGGYEYSYTVARNVNFTFDPASLNLAGKESSITVVYSIVSSPRTTGFYTIDYPDNCPPLIPFAITEGDPASISPADFPGFFMPSSCRLSSPFEGSRITGFSGMSAVWITGPSTQ